MTRPFSNMLWPNEISQELASRCFLDIYPIFHRVQEFVICLPRLRAWSYRLQAWWRHQMETFFALLAICARNSPITGEFPTQRPVMRSFDVFFDLRFNNSLIYTWINGWVNNGEAGDLKRHRAHYDVTVMRMFSSWFRGTWDTFMGRDKSLTYLNAFSLIKHAVFFI